MNPINLFNLLDRFLNRDNNKEIYINKDYCVRLKSPMASCYECINRCPELAINISGNDIEILPSCTNCNACLYICPNYVFYVKKKDGEEPKKHIAVNNNIYFFCSETDSEEIGDKVKCVYEIDLLNIITYLKEGNSLFFITGTCNSCKYNYFHKKIMKNIKEAVSFLNAENEFNEINIKDFKIQPFLDSLRKSDNKKTGNTERNGDNNADDAKEKTVGRREFFKNYITGIKDSGKKIIGEISLDDLPFSELYSHYAGSNDENNKKNNLILLEKRKNIFIFLKKNKELVEQLNISLPKLNKNCIFCGNCWELCPCDALSFKKNKILLNPFLCTGCNLCKDLCSFGAVRMYKAKKLDEISKERVLLSINE